MSLFSYVKGAFETVVSTVKGFVETATSTARNVVETAASTAQGIATTATSTARNVVETAASTAREMANGLITSAKGNIGVVEIGIDVVKSSTFLAELGEWFKRKYIGIKDDIIAYVAEKFEIILDKIFAKE